MAAQPPATPEDVLATERAYMRRARTLLGAMRERTVSLTAQSGDHVSTEYLKASLYRRAKALEDDPSLPLFFGRIDRLQTTEPGSDAPADAETFHIGRRHVMDEAGDPVVVDWRADVARAFYQATRSDPHGVTRRRRFGFAAGELTSFEDEHLLDPDEPDTASRILAEEIEQPRVGPMRDIVATIQPEQDDVVRFPLERSVCVQGAPGTGKTAVGLHRAAYLLHTYRDRLRRTGVLILGPNRAFLHYISQVLPALGEVDVQQMTVSELVDHVPIRGRDDLETAALKGDPRMAHVIRRAIWSHVNDPVEPLHVPRGARTWRVPASEAAETIAALRARGDGYATARALLAQRLAHRVLLRIEASGQVTDDRVQNAVARSRPMKAYVDAIWPALDPAKIVMRLLSDTDFLADAAAGILRDDEQDLIRWSRAPRSVRSAPWTHADAVLVDEATAMMQRFSGLGHVVLDEAQDLSPMELRAVGRRISGSTTVLGDIAQGTTPWATPAWPDALAHLGQEDAHIEILRQGFRVPATVVAFSSRLLPTIAPEIAPPEPVRTNRGQLEVISAGDASFVSTVRRVRERPGSLGVIASDPMVDEVGRWLQEAGLAFGQLDDDAASTLVPASLAKGLEYDHVVVVEPAAIASEERSTGELSGLRRLYVALTRAVSSLTVVHSAPLPEALLDADAHRVPSS
ncbi:AAA family ATPase [Actinobacteria bacterium YIM 96077]|uniref:AAA family ATPase n=1 Tax=Phytoactinopolyspora halophila TaxID=1981511 RepID=A0A329R0B5_9ACTN|nr:ATP-binding domain-containing protein [Phytoactinopolyspora halophila]AYY11560.1 AAA family ATPase [Actinobacteria bacterium YIM 96077]RAW17957.1 AAA family ATPase [Phytoactinopolyspora halophila]